MTKQADIDLGRRSFLGTVKYVAAISVVALTGKSTVSTATTGALPDLGDAASGYRETGHIRKYYESARY